jgi:ABC-type nitrate/sulfonate/bicarbonate transport system ATPase subunit
MSTIIEVKDVKKTFNNGKISKTVLEHLNLTVERNEFVVLFGLAESGKTTLLNLIAGLEPVTDGEILFEGTPIYEPSPERGMVYQNIALFPWLTVMKNVEFGPSVRHENRKERRKKAQHYIDLVGLQGFENTFPVKLSGGMKQRVGIARAYCNDPKVILMDEPFGHLDAQTRYMMEEQIERIYSTDKRTVIFVTNNVEEAVFLADRILLLADKPSHVVKEYKINLPRPRNLISKEFLALRKEITEFMEGTKVSADER